jgi:hypothetical protein
MRKRKNNKSSIHQKLSALKDWKEQLRLSKEQILANSKYAK